MVAAMIPQQFPTIAEREAEFIQVVLGERGQDVEIDIIRSQGRREWRQAQCCQPLFQLVHASIMRRPERPMTSLIANPA